MRGAIPRGQIEEGSNSRGRDYLVNQLRNQGSLTTDNEGNLDMLLFNYEYHEDQGVYVREGSHGVNLFKRGSFLDDEETKYSHIWFMSKSSANDFLERYRRVESGAIIVNNKGTYGLGALGVITGEGLAYVASEAFDATTISRSILHGVVLAGGVLITQGVAKLKSKEARKDFEDEKRELPKTYAKRIQKNDSALLHALEKPDNYQKGRNGKLTVPNKRILQV